MKEILQPLRLQREGFSLLEIIVVIGILAILIALLYPVFGKFTEASRTTKCQSNLRQVGAAIANHVADAGFYPPSRKPVEWSSDPQGPPWIQYLDQYLKWGKWAQVPLNRCPSTKHSYGLNDRFENFYPQNAITNPSKLALLFETDGQYRIATSRLYQITYPHNHLTNILFADGHLEMRTPESIPQYEERGQPHWHQFWSPLGRNP